MDTNEASSDRASRAALRNELRGTVLIVGLAVAVLAGGWLGAAAVGRETVLLGPGVTVTFGREWGESTIGPRGAFSSTRRISRSLLGISPVFEAASREALLALYHREVLDERLPQAVFDEPEPVTHAAGDALPH